MAKQILVAYASGTGSTGEVAKAIGEVLHDGGATVDIRPANDVEGIDDYNAAVLGSSIRAGRWLPDAVDFLLDFRTALATVPVALFTTCLTMVNNTEESRRTVLAYMEPVLARIPAVKPVGIGLFAGSLDPTFAQLAPPSTGPYGDYRDWDAIRAWATAIRPALLSGEATLRQPVTDLSNTVLAFTDLSRSDLSNVDLHGSDLHRANLSEMSLAESDLRQTDLTRSDLHGSNLEQADLHWSTVAEGNLRGTNLYEANLLGADLSNADLAGADLRRAILNGAKLKDTNLQQANLSHADLNWADLSGADLSNADLSHAQLGWANLSTASLDQCNLQQAQYNDYTQWPTGFAPDIAGCISVGTQR